MALWMFVVLIVGLAMIGIVLVNIRDSVEHSNNVLKDIERHLSALRHYEETREEESVK